MEDWGLISYTGGLLLVRPGRSEPEPAARVFGIVAHESPTSGSATSSPPDRGTRSGSTRRSRHGSRTRPATTSTRRWQVPLNGRGRSTDDGPATPRRDACHPLGPGARTAVFDVFDSVTYVKGGAVLGMIEQWLGDGGVPPRAREPTCASDACRTRPRATLVSRRPGLGPRRGGGGGSWTDQPGFPLVASARSASQGRPSRGCRKSASLGGEADSAALWQVPLALVNDKGAHQSLSATDVGGHAAGLRTAGRECRRPRLLSCRLRPGTAPRADAPLHRPCAGRPSRAAERSLRAPAGRTEFRPTSTSRCSTSCRASRTPVAHRCTSRRSMRWTSSTRPSPARRRRRRVRSVGRYLMAPELMRVGWSGAQARIHKSPTADRLIVQLARFDDARVIAEARRRYAEAADGTTLPAGLRSAVIIVVGMDADATRFEQLRARFIEARSDEDRWALRAGADRCSRSGARRADAAARARRARAGQRRHPTAGHDGDAVAAWRTGIHLHVHPLAGARPAGRRDVQRGCLAAGQRTRRSTATTARWSSACCATTPRAARPRARRRRGRLTRSACSPMCATARQHASARPRHPSKPRADVSGCRPGIPARCTSCGAPCAV